MAYGCHPPALGKLRHSEGRSLTRGLCLAELRQGPALSTRLKQRKTASHVCVPSSAGSTQLGWHRPACSGGGLGCSRPRPGQQQLQRWRRGKPAPRFLQRWWGPPPPSSSRAAGSHPPCPGCRQELAWAGGSSPGLGLPPPFVPGATRGAAGLVRQHTEYGAGVLQTHSWGQGGQRNPGDRGVGWGAAVSGRQQSRQKTSPSSPGSRAGAKPAVPSQPGHRAGSRRLCRRREH